MIIQTGMRTDIPAFCTKNPAPMLSRMDVLNDYGQYWFVTITPYGRDIEPNVPDKPVVMENFKRLSDIVGVDSIGWRHDPMSPFLIGGSRPGDVIHQAKQESWIDRQMRLELG